MHDDVVNSLWAADIAAPVALKILSWQHHHSLFGFLAYCFFAWPIQCSIQRSNLPPWQTPSRRAWINWSGRHTACIHGSSSCKQRKDSLVIEDISLSQMVDRGSLIPALWSNSVAGQTTHLKGRSLLVLDPLSLSQPCTGHHRASFWTFSAYGR